MQLFKRDLDTKKTLLSKEVCPVSLECCFFLKQILSFSSLSRRQYHNLTHENLTDLNNVIIKTEKVKPYHVKFVSGINLP